jgi:hypothetical protein
MNDAIHILETCLSLALIWAFWNYGWKSFMLDHTRQRLFSIRDDLFDVALRGEGGLSFSSPVYGILRESLNSNIRFAHRVTFYHIWVAMIFGALPGIKIKQAMRGYKTQAALAIESLPEGDLKKKLQIIQSKTVVTRLIHLFLTSPFFVLCLFAASASILVSTAIDRGLTGSLRLFARAVKDEIKRKELDPSARAVQFQTDAIEKEEIELCAA